MKKIMTRKGNELIFLNPAEKARKYADELGNRAHQTNDGYIKFDPFGKRIPLSDVQASFRSGYLAARKDSAKLYNWKKKKGYLD